MEIIETILLKGARFDKDEDIEITTKRGSKFLATIDFKLSLDYRESIVLQKVDGLNSGWDETTLELNEIESIRIIES